MLGVIFTGSNGTTSISISIFAWQFILQHTAAEAEAVEGSKRSEAQYVGIRTEVEMGHGHETVRG